MQVVVKHPENNSFVVITYGRKGFARYSTKHHQHLPRPETRIERAFIEGSMFGWDSKAGDIALLYLLDR